MGEVGGDASMEMVRLTPRVPTAGDVEVTSITLMTPRGSNTYRGGGGTYRGGGGTYRGGGEKPRLLGGGGGGGEGGGGGASVRPEQLATLDQATLRKLLRKLVRLTVDLEEGECTAVDDAHYPSFAEAWQVHRTPNAF